MGYKRRESTTFGFKAATGLMQGRIRRASETRGFSESRLLTHWAEIVGPDVANVAQPVNVAYGKGGLGATLTVLTTGAQAPMLEMQKSQICERVNACYGYRAIARVRITQTAPTGFAEGRVAFVPAKKAALPVNPQADRAAQGLAGGIENEELRAALASLGAKVLSKSK